MKRSTPMKRTAFKSKGLPPPRPAKQLDGYTPRARPMAVPAVAANASRFAPQPKDNPLQHAGYMALVRRLACARCGRPGPSQFCHADILGAGGKGKGIKSDVRLGWPGCGPDIRTGAPGCHWIVGTSGKLTKGERHAFEAAAGAQTRAKILTAGTWPARLPRWPGDIETPT